MLFSTSSEFHPLFYTHPSHLVPLPLHVFLGLCNRILSQSFTRYFPSQQLTDTMKQIKTIHTAHGGGRSGYQDLNGKELEKLLNRNILLPMIDQLKEVRVKENGNPIIIKHEKIKSNLIKCIEWMKSLQHFLLSSRSFDESEIDSFELLVHQIISDWVKITHTSVTPKVHMLLHCVEFMRTHHALGRYAESQLEHCHSVVNQLLSNNHKNFISDEAERLRRCLADIALRRIQSHI